MKLKQISQLLFVFFLVAFLSSCNSDNNDYTSTSASADAQIYSFALKAKPYTKADTINFPVLAKTQFSIDQFKKLIYNSDSLPYNINLRKVAITLKFGASSVSKLQLRYPKDSIVDWNGSDSVDVSASYAHPPKIIVTAADGTSSWSYDLELRIHKIDPDSMIWTRMPNTSSQQPSTVGRQKTILKGDKFYTFSIDTDNKLALYTASKSDLVWSSRTLITGLSASGIVLESITYFNDMFFAVDNTKKAYSSVDGESWTQKMSGVHSIVGVLPAAADSLLVITEDAGKYVFAKTLNFTAPLSVVKQLSNNLLSNEVALEFPSQGFSSSTDYTNKVLNITGGVDFNNNQKKLTWLLRADNNRLELACNQPLNVPFEAKAGISSFFYDQYLYVLAQNQFYKTASAGYKWIKAPTKEDLPSGMPKASGQTIIVDNENYIWVFGGVSDSGATPVRQVWRARLNKLIKR